MISDVAVGHIRHFRLGDTLLFDKIYLHSLDVNLDPAHPVTTTMEKLRDRGVVEELPNELKSEKLRETYPIDAEWSDTEDTELLAARLMDSIMDSTIRQASLGIRTSGRSCTLLVDEQALQRTKSKSAQSITGVRIDMVRVDPALDTPAEKILEMLTDPQLTADVQNFYSYFSHVAKYGFQYQ